MVFNMVLDRGGTRLKGEVLSAKVTGQNFEEGELCSYSPPGWEWNHDSGFDSNRPVRGIALDDDTYMQVCNNHSARYAVMIRKSTGERSTPVLIFWGNSSRSGGSKYRQGKRYRRGHFHSRHFF